MCEDYKDIAASVSEDSDYDELLIVSELYLNKYVKQSNFSGDFSKQSMEKYKTVYDKLSEIYNNSYTDLDREERNEMKSQLAALKTVIKNPALGKIEEGLLEYANDEYSIDASKAYLQMAKIEHSLGNTIKSSQYIDRSIDTVGDCEDNDYTVPMYELVGIISDKDNPERLKDAATYVEQVLDNNMTVKMSDTSDYDNDDYDDDDDDEDSSLAGDFASQMQTYVSQKRMSVNIVNVDTSSFENGGTIKATVNISDNLYNDPDELKAALKIEDCGVEITDFKVEKVDYSGANILLCVDTSGSMGGDKIENLKNAIKLFLEDKADIEDVALVTFESNVLDHYPFGSSVDTLNSAADNIYSGGGTAIYHSLIYSIEQFSDNSGEINSIILMTDGQDGYWASSEEIEENVGIPCQEKGITVYTIGFGSDADGTYLEAIASATGGSYVYASDPTASSQVNQLEEFFKSLRAQILNQYIITYNVVDTLSYKRELKVSVGESLDSDRATYYISGTNDSIVEEEDGADSPVFLNNKAVYGFVPKLLFKNGKTMTASFKGDGFTADDRITITLKGNTTGIEWNLGTSFVDTNTLSITVPAGIGIDTYDVYASINGKIAVIKKGLSIFKQGSEQITDFGQYRFVSYVKQKSGGTTTLSGYVTMNGWLNFNGDVMLSDSNSENSVVLTELNGSYVDYSALSSTGLAKALATAGMNVELPPLGTITLHNSDGKNDPEVKISFLDFADFGEYFGFSGIEAKLFPNRIEFTAESGEADLPMADQILNGTSSNLFAFSLDKSMGITVSSSNINLTADIKISESDDWYKSGNLGNMPLSISPANSEIHIDTYSNKYEFKFAAKLSFIDGKGVGVSAKWDSPDDGDSLSGKGNGLVPTMVKLYADIPVNTVIASVPVTFSGFSLGVEDIDISKNPFHWTLAGGCDIEAAKLSSVESLKGLTEYFGDVSVVSLDGAELKLSLGECFIKAKTKVKLLSKIDCGSVEINMGNFDYQSTLLNMDKQKVSGLMAKVSAGTDWDMKKGAFSVNVDIKGSGEIDITNRFIGAQFSGSFKVDVKLWIVKMSSGDSVSGEIAIGIRVMSDGSPAFVIRSSPWNADVTWPKNSGKVV